MTGTAGPNPEAERGYKYILTEAGGSVEFVGAHDTVSSVDDAKGRPWTTLSRTAWPGDSVISVTEPQPSWRIGDRIAIASSDFDADQAEALCKISDQPDHVIGHGSHREAFHGLLKAKLQ